MKKHYRQFLILSIVIFCCCVLLYFHRLYRSDDLFVVMPHHIITWKTIDQFYRHLKRKYWSFDSVVLISPNHYALQKEDYVALNKNQNICFKNNCIFWKKLFDTHQSIDVKAGWLIIEHWIGEHITFVKKYFWKVNFFPILSKRTITSKLKNDDFYSKINHLEVGRTLYIASVDFSHHVDESFAKFHDIRSVDALRFWDMSSIEVDCPNCLKVIYDWASKYWYNDFDLFARTSVDTIMGNNTKTQNTSHVFGEFIKKKIKKPSIITLAVFGDTNLLGIYDEKWIDFWKRYLKTFFQWEDITKSLAAFYHRKLYGFDFVLSNLETTVIPKKEDCQTYKSMLNFSIWMEKLNLIKEIGVNILNISNNHMQDCGKSWYIQTKKNLESSDIPFFWNVFGDVNVWTGSIRGQDISFLWFNEINEKISDEEKIKLIKSFKSAWYIVMVSIHWWKEYEVKQNERQIILWHKLIDAWADTIIWHHPHVIQWYEVYKGKPVFYSLWNFLFDQWIPQTKKWMSVLFSISRDSINFLPVYFDMDRWIVFE